MSVQISKRWLGEARTRKTEVTKFNIKVIIWEYILWFEVPVQYFHRGKVFQDDEQLISNLDDLLIV